MDFKGKVALITGAGNGIGRAAALGFARDGAKVVVVDRDTAGGEGTAGIIRQQGGEALFVAADVTKSADVQAYVKAALDAFEEAFGDVYGEAQQALDEDGRDPHRAAFAERVKNHPQKGLLFALLDGKPIADKIWKMLKPTYEKPFASNGEDA